MESPSNSTNMESPSGGPDELFFLPEVLRTRNYMVDVDLHELEQRRDAAIDLRKVVAQMNFSTQLAEIIMREKSLQFPSTPEEATTLYVTLLEEIVKI